MIPILLTIKGLYSYQQTQIIDFTKLIEGQLFGIFGAVGSGKSSILEAISFALYGDTERLNKAGDDRNNSMMNLNSNELFIDFIFKNHDDVEYRFTVKGKRNSKNFEDVKTLDRCAYKKENETWLPLEKPSAEEILGLSYTNFKRTIIIPQGKFQEFLQLTEGDRMKMLKEIFALEKYEFSLQTSALQKKNDEALHTLNGQLVHFEQTTPEGILEAEKKVESLETEVEKFKTEILVKEKQIKLQEEIKTLFSELEISQKQLDNLLGNQQTYQQYETKIKNYEYCTLHFKDNFSRKNELEANIKTLEKNSEELNILHLACIQNLEDLEKNSIAINEQYLKLDDYKQEAAEYQHLLSLQKTLTETQTLTSRITKGQNFIETAIDKKTTADTKIINLKEQLKSQKNNLPDLSVLADLKTWFTKNQALQNNIQTVSNDILSSKANLQIVENQIKNEILHPVFLNATNKITPQNAEQNIADLKQSFYNQTVELQNQLANYNLQKKLGEFSEMLHDGEPCMLCGATHHPQILKVEDVEEQLKTANIQIKNNKKNNDELEIILRNLLNFTNKKELILQQIADFSSKLNLINQEAEAHLQKFIWLNYKVNDIDLVNAQFASAAQTQQDIKSTETTLEKEEASLVLATAELEKYKQAITDFNNQLAAKQAEKNTLQKQIKVLAVADFENFTETQLVEQSNQISQQINHIQTQYNQINNQLLVAGKTEISLAEQQKNTLSNLNLAQTTHQKIEENIKVELEKSIIQTQEEISAILVDNFDFEGLKNQVILYNQQLFNAKQNIQKLQNSCAGKTFDALIYQQNLDNFLLIRQKFEQTNSDFIKEKNALEIAIKNLAKKLILTTQLEKLQNRATNISTLKQLFSGSGFVSYMAQVHLQNLCANANQRFYALSRQQFRLEVNQKNVFLVRDYLNNGKTRLAKTLSGGQTFLASLSLALALAQSVQQQNKANQNFFFLDEGFGSLDKEALQLAFETLKQLRKENRIVGIISHVEDLQQEIDIYLTVVNDAFLGSQIKPSWV
ncbi:MAG: SMC family ATPase [Sphingobacteriales bacterium]|nr:MAG: SMC family ATPase [Sphingobacteriales bacterium]